MSAKAFQPLIVIIEAAIMCIIIGDVHQFIGFCLIPLDPCIFKDKESVICMTEGE